VVLNDAETGPLSLDTGRLILHLSDLFGVPEISVAVEVQVPAFRKLVISYTEFTRLHQVLPQRKDVEVVILPAAAVRPGYIK